MVWPRHLLWKLTKLPYGIVEAGRQWQKTFESWLLDEAGFDRIFGISQLYRLRDVYGRTRLLIAKVTDDLLMSGSVAAIEEFTRQLQGRFEISKVVIDTKVEFNGCTLSQTSHGDIRMSMQSVGLVVTHEREDVR